VKGVFELKFKYKRDPRAFHKVLALTQPFTTDELTELLLPIRSSFEALRTGKATDRDAGDIISVVNVVGLMSMKIHPDAVAAAHAAVYAMGRAVERHKRTGAWGLDGPGLAEVEQGIAMHEQLCQHCTPRQMRDAMLRVQELQKA